MALSGNYEGFGFCYTGAEVGGKMHLSAPGQAPLSYPINQIRHPPSQTSTCPSSPAGAPFKSAWLTAILRGLVHLWGPQVIEQTLWDTDAAVRYATRRLISEMGPEGIPFLLQALRADRNDQKCILDDSIHTELQEIGMDGVPALIKGLKSDDSCVRLYARNALSAITYQNFGKDAAAWQAWWDAGAPMVGPDLGRKYTYEHACHGCHSVDDRSSDGPNFQGLFGSQRTLQDGTTIQADEQYLYESIVDPDAKIAQDLADSGRLMPMPDDYAQELDEEQIASLIEYIKTLKDKNPDD